MNTQDRSKLLSSLRRFGNGSSFEQIDDQCRMSPESQRQYTYIFIEVRFARFGPKYLNREPKLAELQILVEAYKLLGFPCCAGSVDCIILFWKKCRRLFKGKYKNPLTGNIAAITCDTCVTELYIVCPRSHQGVVRTMT
jgi:hypothetical protein